jgi:uncharacterized sporulation protein YeaH/YhbH (DUF444 family)
MARRIEEDHQSFLDVFGGRIRRALKKYIRGEIVRGRTKNGKFSFSIPKIDQPKPVYGNNEEGAGRGKGKPGDVIGRDPKKGKNGAGNDEGEAITISFDLEEVLKFLQHELQLPNLKPKPNETFEEVKIRYNNISLIGPESLRHNRRTYLQAIKRQAMMGTLNELHYVPGSKDPLRLIVPWQSDKRYRQYNEIRIPSSNALVIFARDGSGSMDAYKCDVVSDMSWWIDVWVRRFYERVERMFVWHDSIAMEVDEEKFYGSRFGGGTNCSSAFKFIAKQFENRFPPDKWNIYLFYFTDGDNWEEDNQSFIQVLKEKFPNGVVNLIGITQIMASTYDGTVKQQVDFAIKDGVLDKDIIRTVTIGNEMGGSYPAGMPEEQRNEQILKAIKYLLGGNKEKVSG